MEVINKKIDLYEYLKKPKESSLLMMDYDGTLSPLIENRMKAFPEKRIKQELISLMKLEKLRLVIVSGRPLIDLERLLGIRHLEMWGSHGLERKLVDGTVLFTDSRGDYFKGIHQATLKCQNQFEPECIEIKPYGVAIHWRGKTEEEKQELNLKAQAIFKEMALNYPLEIHPFNEGLELRPQGGNKGIAVESLLNETADNTFVAYLGDDLTDEDAFKIIGAKGLKVLVSSKNRPTLADIRLINFEEVLWFLNKLRENL